MMGTEMVMLEDSEKARAGKSEREERESLIKREGEGGVLGRGSAEMEVDAEEGGGRDQRLQCICVKR
jgi:hypothetical protein